VIPGIAVQLGHNCRTPHGPSIYRLAPTFVGAGLAVLMASMAWPAVPPVTGMALVALGATAATIQRFRNLPALLPILFAYGAIYGGLYALFIRAVLASHVGPTHQLAWPTAVDLVLSTVPMAAAIGVSVDAVRAVVLAE
jgi:hypothetical protein